MPKIKKLRKKFFRWRYKNLSNQQFIYLLSILVGFLSGLGTVAIKNLTHFIQSALKVDFIREYHLSFYFVFPIIFFRQFDNCGSFTILDFLPMTHWR